MKKMCVFIENMSFLCETENLLQFSKIVKKSKKLKNDKIKIYLKYFCII